MYVSFDGNIDRPWAGHEDVLPPFSTPHVRKWSPPRTLHRFDIQNFAEPSYAMWLFLSGTCDMFSCEVGCTEDKCYRLLNANVTHDVKGFEYNLSFHDYRCAAWGGGARATRTNPCFADHRTARLHICSCAIRFAHEPNVLDIEFPSFLQVLNLQLIAGVDG